MSEEVQTQTPSKAATLLEVRDLGVVSAMGAPLVRDVSFSNAAGERLSLIGEYGSGK